MTVSWYVPAGVPFGFVCELDELPPPPPQEQTNSSNRNGRVRPARNMDRFLLAGPGKKISPKMATAQNHGECWERLGARTAVVLDVVLTATLKVEAVVALTLTLEGTEQSAPMGAPVHVSVAVPLTPATPNGEVVIRRLSSRYRSGS